MDILLVVSMALGVSVLLMSVLVVVMARRVGPLQRARQHQIAALCTQRGLSPGAAPGDFAMLGAIYPRWLTNVFSSPDHGVAVADFERPAGKNTQFFSILAFTVAGVNLPRVAVTRRNLSGITLGGPPTVELESTDFDQQFTVKANDRRSAVMLLDPGMMQLLLDCGDVNFDMVGDRVLAFVNRLAERPNQPFFAPLSDPRRTEPVGFEKLFEFWDGFVTRVPELLRTEYAATT